MKQILVFSTAYDPYWGGAEIAIREITKHLSSEFKFTLITYRFNKNLLAVEEIEGVRIFRLGWGTFFDKLFVFPFLSFFKAWKLIRNNQVALLWSVMVSYAGIGAYFSKLVFKKIPLLLTLQEGDLKSHLKYGKGGQLGLWWKLLLKKADYVQAISAYLADYAIERGYRGKIAIVPNGVEIEKFATASLLSTQEKYKKFFGLQESDILIVTASRLVRKNAVDVSINALKYLDLRYKLLVVGSGVEKEILQRLAVNLGVESRVIFAGEISHRELPDYLHLARVFVRPSRSEGLGSAFLESMAAGVPIVGTAVGGIPEFLKNLDTGLFCKVDNAQDLAQKIIQITTDKELDNKLKNNAYTLVKARYSWDTVSQDMRKILRELIYQA